MQTQRAAAGEHDLVRALQAGNEDAFATLVDEYSPMMLRVARLYLPSHAVAEEVVQDTWISVLRAIGTFQGRSSLRTWLFTILVNAAKKQSARERRSTSFSALAAGELAEGDLLIDRFFAGDHPRWAGCWTSVVPGWDRVPERRLNANETRRAIEGAIKELPPVQRAVFTLRDVEGWSADEVCNGLELTGSNQRVLLHRARLKVRAALEPLFESAELQ